MINLKVASDEAILEAATILKNGGVVVLPTDTNYNVVTSPYSKEGVDRIFAMKNRESLSPLTLFLGDSMEMSDYAYTTPETEKLAKMLWPEKISFILYQKATTPHYVTRGFGSVAVTLHQNPTLRKVAHLLGTPLAGTSANLSGTGNVPNVSKAVEHIGEKVDLIIDGGLSKIDGANTIVDFTFTPPLLARNGAYPLESILKLIPNLQSNLKSAEYKSLAKSRAISSDKI
jgi:L-threonylcarbamoyladenylate synthase